MEIYPSCFGKPNTYNNIQKGLDVCSSFVSFTVIKKDFLSQNVPELKLIEKLDIFKSID